jgi:hypothetical protein
MSQRVGWRRSALDSGVIVLSILLAFSIDAWWDTRLERVQRVELLADLHSDFSMTMGLLATSLEAHETLLSHNRAVQAAASGGVPVPADSLSRFVRDALNGASFTPAITNYEAAIASGAIHLIESDSLLVYLNRFDHGLEGFQQISDLGGQFYFMGPIQAVIPEFGGFEALLRSDELVEVVRRPAFQAIVEVVGDLQRNAVSNLRQMDRASRTITDELTRLLGRQ